MSADSGNYDGGDVYTSEIEAVKWYADRMSYDLLFDVFKHVSVSDEPFSCTLIFH